MAAPATPGPTPVEIEGRTLTLTNLDKVLYPQAGFTKAAVIDYYLRIAPVLLPHLRGRELTMVRWPDGVVCPRCQSRTGWPARRHVWLCAGCGYEASVTAGTIFQDTRHPL